MFIFHPLGTYLVEMSSKQENTGSLIKKIRGNKDLARKLGLDPHIDSDSDNDCANDRGNRKSLIPHKARKSKI